MGPNPTGPQQEGSAVAGAKPVPDTGIQLRKEFEALEVSDLQGADKAKGFLPIHACIDSINDDRHHPA